MPRTNRADEKLHVALYSPRTRQAGLESAGTSDKLCAVPLISATAFFGFWVLAVDPFLFVSKWSWAFVVTGTLLGALSLSNLGAHLLRRIAPIWAMALVTGGWFGSVLLENRAWSSTKLGFPPELLQWDGVDGPVEMLGLIRLSLLLAVLGASSFAVIWYRETLLAMAAVFSMVIPMVVLFKDPEIRFGLGQYLQFSNSQMALFPSAGTAAVATLWLLGIVNRRIAISVLLVNLVGAIFVVPIATGVGASLVAFVVTCYFVWKRCQRREAVSLLEALILASVIPLLALAVLFSNSVRGPIAAVFNKDPTFSGRVEIWSVFLESVGKSPLTVRVSNAAESSMRDPHSLYVETLYRGGVLIGSLMILSFILFTTWVIRKKRPFAPLMFWIGTWAVSSPVRFEMFSADGFIIWLSVLMALLSTYRPEINFNRRQGQYVRSAHLASRDLSHKRHS